MGHRHGANAKRSPPPRSSSALKCFITGKEDTLLWVMSARQNMSADAHNRVSTFHGEDLPSAELQHFFKVCANAANYFASFSSLFVSAMRSSICWILINWLHGCSIAGNGYGGEPFRAHGFGEGALIHANCVSFLDEGGCFNVDFEGLFTITEG